MMAGTWLGALQILIPKYDVEAVLDGDPRLPADLLPRRADDLRLAAEPSEGRASSASSRSASSTAAPRRCPLEVIEQFERTHRPAAERRLWALRGLAGDALDAAARPCASRARSACRCPTPTSKIVDLETGTRELPLGEAGELCICGPQVMKGYWNRPDETAHALRTHADGRVWLHTGDIAHDRRGRLHHASCSARRT